MITQLALPGKLMAVRDSLYILIPGSLRALRPDLHGRQAYTLHTLPDGSIRVEFSVVAQRITRKSKKPQKKT